MGVEDRGSSGSSTVMIVLAVLGGLLLVGCCGGGVVMIGGVFWARTAAREVQVEMERANLEIQRSQAEVEKANAEMREQLESIKLPDVPSLTLPPEGAATPSLPPASDPSKEESK
ncbi:MAG: hypothetical protein K8R36_07065 [Planctomycetales bacterium]|nr:hypothetical protein [Planctomycetales bacterium]